MSRLGQVVAILVEDGFEDHELTGITEGLAAAGMVALIVAPVASRPYTGRHGLVTITSQLASGLARARMFGAIVIPGGYSPDRIRMRHAMVDLVRESVEAGRLVAAIGHGAQVLISARAVKGRTLTCWPSIAIDVTNAGGLYVDRPVVEDGPLITARKAADVPRFIAALVGALDAQAPASWG